MLSWVEAHMPHRITNKSREIQQALQDDFIRLHNSVFFNFQGFSKIHQSLLQIRGTHKLKFKIQYKEMRLKYQHIFLVLLSTRTLILSST